MDPISVLSVIGGGTIIYNACSYMYTYMYPVDDISNERILEIEKELIEESHNEILEKVNEIKESFDIDYEDVLRELREVLELRNESLNESSSSDLPIPFDESTSDSEE